jgi:hypothetical protein
MSLRIPTPIFKKCRAKKGFKFKRYAEESEYVSVQM